jgi:hypothetical protein
LLDQRHVVAAPLEVGPQSWETIDTRSDSKVGRLLGAFRKRERALHRKLPTARFEEWDRGWARVGEPVAYERLDAALRDDLAKRLAMYVATLEPILRDELPADVPWSL